MSKMNDLSMTIEELRNAAAAISDAADWLVEHFSESVDKPSTLEKHSEPEPKPRPQLTLEEVRAVLADKSRAGHTAAVREILQKYGANKLSQIDPENYAALLQDAEVLGDAT